MKKTLIDTGPLIALFDRDDKYHNKTVEFLKKHTGILVTSWPVMTEVLHVLRFNSKVQIDFVKWVHKGGLQVQNLYDHSLAGILELSRKYPDVPMDLAEASLIVISEEEKIKEIISIDCDFSIYRNIREKYLKNIFL